MSSHVELLNEAVALHQAGRLDDAEAGYRKVLAASPQNADALHLLGVLEIQRGNYADAIPLIQQAIAQNNSAWSYHSNLAYALQEANRLDEAIASYQQAVMLAPFSASLYSNLATAYEQQGNYEEAELHYLKALEIDPGYAEAHYNLGNLRRKQERYDDAIRCYEQAVRCRPDYSEAHANLANLLQDQGQTEESIRSYHWAIEANPTNVEAHYNLGRALKALGRFDEALAAYDRAIELRPDYAEAHNARGLLLLRLGNFAEGWPEYEWRWRKVDATPLRELPYPLWQGESLADKTLFVYSEQGIGDEIMFGSCLPDVVDAANHCIIECDERLVPLFQRSFPTTTVHAREGWSQHAWLAECPTVHYQVPVGNLPRYLRADLASFPQRESFLRADRQRIEHWRRRLTALGEGLKIGICWRGRRDDEQKRDRSTDLREWTSLLKTEGLRFVSLQYGPCNDELAEVCNASNVEIHRWDDLNPDVDIDELAALMSSLDLIITVGNTTAHLAGALGLNVWTLLSVSPSWRWMEDRADSPWYPRMRLFRQTTKGNWSDVFQQVIHELRQHPDISSHASPPERLQPKHPPLQEFESQAVEKPPTEANNSQAVRSLERSSDYTAPSPPGETPRPVDSDVPMVEADETSSNATTQSATTTQESDVRLTDQRLGLCNCSLEEAYQHAVAAHRAKDFVRAEGIYRELLRHRPRNVATLHMLACLTRETGRPEQAAELAKKALLIEPRKPLIHVNLATALLDLERYDEAKPHLEKAIELDPNCGTAYVNFAALYERQGELDVALKYARRGVQLAPDMPCAHYNLANILFHLGEIEECIAAHQRVLQLNPDYAKSRWNLGLAYLVTARFKEGWEGYEYREASGQVDIDHYPQPRWDGSPLSGKTLLIHAEQGVGDEIMFASCYREVIEQAGHCVLLCEPRLAPLLSRSFPEATVHGVRRIIGRPWIPPEDIDLEIPAGSLPRLLRPSWESFPRKPFLVPDPSLTQIWRDRLDALGEGLKIGISWRAGGRAKEQRRRTTLLEHWTPLFRVPGIHWVNLQYGDCQQAIESARHRWGIEIHDWSDADPTADMDSFAAQVAALDFVISVGNTTIHMAGAVGVPAWTVLPKVPGWRYLLEHDEMPWYRDIRLFRQPEFSDWEGLFQQIATRLENDLDDGSLISLATQRREQRFQALQQFANRRSSHTTVAAQISAPPSSDTDTPHVAIRHNVPSETDTQAPANSSALSQAGEVGALRNSIEAPSHGGSSSSTAEQEEAITRQLTEAIQHHRANNLSTAETIYLDVLEQDAENVDALHLLGTLRYTQGDLPQAVELIRSALQRRPRPIIHYNLANALRDSGQIDEAIAHYEQAVSLDPHLAEAHLNLGALLRSLGRLDEAKESLRRALLASPEMADAHTQLGLVHVGQRAPVKALKSFERAAELHPNVARAHMHVAGVLRQLGRSEEALERYAQALELDPTDADIHVQRGMLLLQLGRFKEGWPEWQWRWRSQQSPHHRNFPQPRWDGSPLEGKRILVHGEQGLGDEIMFASCLGEVVQQAQQCIVECEPRLASLFRRSFPSAIVHPRQSWHDVEWINQYGNIDVQAPSGDLPTILRRCLSDFPKRTSFLVADAALRTRWRERLAALPGKMKIGISWIARNGPEEPPRTAPLVEWKRLWQLDDIQFVSLQYGDCSQELNEARQRWDARIATWDDLEVATDFENLAALMCELDLVITVGNTTAHLAGALGTRVWTLLSAAPSWRWLAGRTDSPWYPTMRVFQQRSIYGWQSVFEQLEKMLRFHGNKMPHRATGHGIPAPHALARSRTAPRS